MTNKNGNIHLTGDLNIDLLDKRKDINNHLSDFFADNNTLSATCQSSQQLVDTLEQESESAVILFRQNEIIVNPNKCQAIILKNESKTKVNLNIYDENVNITDTVKLLRIEIDKHLTFDTHIAKPRSKAAVQL